MARIVFLLIRFFIPAHIGSTEEFMSCIRGVNWKDDNFASLDIADLFGSIPVHDNTFPGALTLTADFIDQHKANTALAEVSRQEIW